MEGLELRVRDLLLPADFDRNSAWNDKGRRLRAAVEAELKGLSPLERHAANKA